MVVDLPVESLPGLLQLFAHRIGRQSHFLKFQEGCAEFAGGHASKDFSSLPKARKSNLSPGW
jgi:hypothetical protein